MLGQLTLLFGFFALVLVAVYWINHAIVLFDQLIADGHTGSVFVEFTLLSLPKIIALVLPIAGFAAAVYVTNRLSNDSELLVMQATGFSSRRMARPMVVFGLFLSVLSAILLHVLVPISSETLRDRETEISGSVTARLLREGVFLHPVDGVTFYIREISAEGELRDVFLTDIRDPAREVTYVSNVAYLIRDEDGPKLVMVDGLAQDYDTRAQKLSTTTFEELIRDVSGLMAGDGPGRRKLSYVSSLEMLRDPASAAQGALRTQAHVTQEMHWRMSQALLCLVAALVGQATLLAGGFSRFGVARHVVAAVGILVFIKIIEGAVSDFGSKIIFWPQLYLPSLIGIMIAAALYWRADHPFARAFPRARRATPPGEAAP